MGKASDTSGLYSIFVGNLSKQTTRSELEALFVQYGTPKKVYIADLCSPLLHTYGFVRFILKESAINAVTEMNGYVHRGMKLRVEISSENPKKLISPADSDYFKERKLREDLEKDQANSMKLLALKLAVRNHNLDIADHPSVNCNELISKLATMKVKLPAVVRADFKSSDASLLKELPETWSDAAARKPLGQFEEMSSYGIPWLQSLSLASSGELHSVPAASSLQPVKQTNTADPSLVAKFAQHNHAVPLHARKVPPSHHKVPPSHREVPPSHYKVPPSHHKVPPSHREVPPSHYKVPPSHHKVPPSHHEVPPNHHKVPPSHHEVPPSHHKVPPTDHSIPDILMDHQSPSTSGYFSSCGDLSELSCISPSPSTSPLSKSAVQVEKLNPCSIVCPPPLPASSHRRPQGSFSQLPGPPMMPDTLGEPAELGACGQLIRQRHNWKTDPQQAWRRPNTQGQNNQGPNSHGQDNWGPCYKSTDAGYFSDSYNTSGQGRPLTQPFNCTPTPVRFYPNHSSPFNRPSTTMKVPKAADAKGNN